MLAFKKSKIESERLNSNSAIALAPDTTAGWGVHAQPTARLARKATRRYGPYLD